MRHALSAISVFVAAVACAWGYQYGDMNCDGRVDTYDIEPFVQALVNRSDYQTAFPDCLYTNADVDRDGRVDTFDIDAFLAALLGAPTEENLPLNILYYGNSFSTTGTSEPGEPELIEMFATVAGYPPPRMENACSIGQSLYFHGSDPNQLAKITDPNAVPENDFTWDAVVIQPGSRDFFFSRNWRTRNLDYGVALVDAIGAHSPQARLVIFETWAWHPRHPLYDPNSPEFWLADPYLFYLLSSSGYEDYLELIQQTTTFGDNLEFVPIGTAMQFTPVYWGDTELGSVIDLPLLTPGEWRHPTSAGRYFAALFLYAQLYDTNDLLGLPHHGCISESDAALLQGLVEDLLAEMP